MIQWRFAGPALLILVAGGRGATVSFESIPAGRSFGASFGQSPGEEIHSTPEGIRVTVEQFTDGTSPDLFNEARVLAPGDRYADVFPSRAVRLNNISLEFNFELLGFDVSWVTIDYAEFGGTNNITVNGEATHEVRDLTQLTPDVATGVSAMVGPSLITFSGVGAAIRTIRVGGQELVIDNVVAVPDPPCGVLLLTAALFGLHTRRFR